MRLLLSVKKQSIDVIYLIGIRTHDTWTIYLCICSWWLFLASIHPSEQIDKISVCLSNNYDFFNSKVYVWNSVSYHSMCDIDICLSEDPLGSFYLSASVTKYYLFDQRFLEHRRRRRQRRAKNRANIFCQTFFVSSKISIRVHHIYLSSLSLSLFIYICLLQSRCTFIILLPLSKQPRPLSTVHLLVIVYLLPCLSFPCYFNYCLPRFPLYLPTSS